MITFMRLALHVRPEAWVTSVTKSRPRAACRSTSHGSRWSARLRDGDDGDFSHDLDGLRHRSQAEGQVGWAAAGQARVDVLHLHRREAGEAGMTSQSARARERNRSCPMASVTASTVVPPPCSSPPTIAPTIPPPCPSLTTPSMDPRCSCATTGKAGRAPTAAGRGRYECPPHPPRSCRDAPPPGPQAARDGQSAGTRPFGRSIRHAQRSHVTECLTMACGGLALDTVEQIDVDPVHQFSHSSNRRRGRRRPRRRRPPDPA